MCVPRKNNREKWDKSQRLRIKKNFNTNETSEILFFTKIKVQKKAGTKLNLRIKI